jgi:carboxypeptidase Taq
MEKLNRQNARHDPVVSEGSLLTTDELVKQAPGETLSASYVKDHLKSRYL